MVIQPPILQERQGLKMAMEFVSEIIDAMVQETLYEIYISLWLMGLSMIWKWFLGVAKRFLHWLFPKRFSKKNVTADKN